MCGLGMSPGVHIRPFWAPSSSRCSLRLNRSKVFSFLLLSLKSWNFSFLLYFELPVITFPWEPNGKGIEKENKTIEIPSKLLGLQFLWSGKRFPYLAAGVIAIAAYLFWGKAGEKQNRDFLSFFSPVGVPFPVSLQQKWRSWSFCLHLVYSSGFGLPSSSEEEKRKTLCWFHDILSFGFFSQSSGDQWLFSHQTMHWVALSRDSSWVQWERVGGVDFYSILPGTRNLDYLLNTCWGEVRKVVASGKVICPKRSNYWTDRPHGPWWRKYLWVRLQSFWNTLLSSPSF